VLADRVGIIDHGRIVAEGTPEQLKAEISRLDRRGRCRPTCSRKGLWPSCSSASALRRQASVPESVAVQLAANDG
jgi:ABC-2 type transport system ATP-binding protein